MTRSKLNPAAHAWLTELFLRNHALYGDARMEGEPPADDGKGTGGDGKPEQDPAPQEDGKEFKAITSQEELEKVMQSRLARERAKFPDYATYKAKAEQFDALGDVTELKSKAETAEQRNTKLSDAIRKRELLGAVKEHNLLLADDDALALIGLDGIEIDEEGSVTGAADKVKSFADARPQYVSTETPPAAPAGFGAQDGQPSAPAGKKPLADQINEAIQKRDWSLAGRLRSEQIAEQRKNIRKR